MATPQVGLCQRSFNPATNQAHYVLRNFAQTPDRYNTYFAVTILNPPQLVGAFKHGGEFNLPAGELLPVSVAESDSAGNLISGDTLDLTLQPYRTVCTGYKIFHFFHQTKKTVWAIGDSPNQEVQILRSSDYFNTFDVVHSWPENQFDQFGEIYRAMYIDKFGNIIVGSRPSPLISRDGGQSWQALGFKWQDEDHGILSPFWNITESESEGLLVISEYGDSQADTQPHGSHRGTFWSYDQKRTHWVTRPVDRSFDRSDYLKFGGYFRHIHGYHINPILPNIHLMFLGDSAKDQSPDGTPGYYVSQDGGRTWSTEILVEYDSSRRYNGPCCVTWWPSGKAFITSDTAENGHAYWWGNGPATWGAPGLNPAIELQGRVDEEAGWPETPWMAMAVQDTYETYCATGISAEDFDKKEVLWRYDGDPATDGNTGRIQVLAENYSIQGLVFESLKWLSGSRGNTIPSKAKYFFTSGGRRFPRK